MLPNSHQPIQLVTIIAICFMEKEAEPHKVCLVIYILLLREDLGFKHTPSRFQDHFPFPFLTVVL